MSFLPIKNLLSSVAYYFVKLLVSCCRLSGYKKISVGSCVFLGPKKQMEIILQGINFLKILDLEMYGRVTLGRRLVMVYCKKATYLRCREFFIITKNFLDWGKEGVALCLVQYNFELANEADFQSPEVTAATRHKIRQQVFNWIKDKPFSEELICQYTELALQK